MIAVRILAAIALAGAAALPAAAGEVNCSRIVALGDLHGGIDAAQAILQHTGMMDAAGAWTGADACLVQMGDMVDRGPRSREVLDLFLRLEEQAPSRVHVVLANHEALVFTGDLRYVDPGEFLAFRDEETATERDAAYARWSADENAVGRGGNREEFDRAFAPGYFAFRRAFAPDGKYGADILSRPVAVRLGRTLFVHGGMTPESAAVGIDALTARAHAELLDYAALIRRLSEAGWFSPWAPPQQALPAAGERLKTPDGMEPELREAATRFVALKDAMFIDPNSPMWTRELATADEGVTRPRLDQVLRALDVDRIVVGHTTTADLDFRISPRFDGNVVLIDTGMGPAYGGRPSALEIVGETARAVYLDGERPLPLPAIPDAVWEDVLAHGRIVSSEAIGSGVTKPYKVMLEHGGRQFKAAFKSVDVRKMDMTRGAGGKRELGFRDYHGYDQAAYVLDRRIGLGMVAPAMVREALEREGVMVAWISGAIDETERLERRWVPPDPATYQHERGLMQLFDALIANVDRNQGNILTTVADGRVHLIDHTRAFRRGTDLPAEYLKQTSALSRALYNNLRSLTASELQGLLGKWVERPAIDDLLVRRDRIVAKIDQDVARYGAAVVFLEPAAQEP